MHNQNIPSTLRRSSRVPVAIPILVTSLAPETHFSEVCPTLVVSAHGCAMRSPVKLETGVPLHFHSKDGRETTAQVVYCQPIGSNSQSWRLGAKLDRPENFWGLRDFPKDWASLLTAPVVPPLPALALKTEASNEIPGQLSESSDVLFDNEVPNVSEEHFKRMIAESVRPLQAEVTALKEKLARAEGNRSRFEVSLSSIPPELEQQLELRLQKDLGPRVLDEARKQSAQLLADAKTIIDQRTSEANEDFLHRVAGQLQAVEQRAQEIPAQISENVREQLRGGLGEFQQKLLDGGNQLKRLSEELLEFLQHSLNDEHNTRLGELEQVRTGVALESSRLHERIEYLDNRIAKLDESVRSLESGSDQRLSQMASDTLRNTRSELEGAAETVLKEWTTRNVQALGNQLDEACENMKIVQKGIVASVSESLRGQSADALQSFEHSMQELAKLSVERWRLTLAGGLKVLVKNLGEQFRLEAESGNGKDQR
jgi:hypothetical protein